MSRLELTKHQLSVLQNKLEEINTHFSNEAKEENSNGESIVPYYHEAIDMINECLDDKNLDFIKIIDRNQGTISWAFEQLKQGKDITIEYWNRKFLRYTAGHFAIVQINKMDKRVVSAQGSEYFVLTMIDPASILSDKWRIINAEEEYGGY